MSQNIHQIFLANPATNLVSTDLFYLGRSPYNTADDFAISAANLIASINPATWIDETTTPITMTTNTGYTSDAGASLLVFTLPATATIGDFVEINGKNAGLWQIAQAAGQQIRFGNLATTLGVTGFLASTLQYDCIRLRCITANTTWVVVSSIGNITVA